MTSQILSNIFTWFYLTSQIWSNRFAYIYLTSQIGSNHLSFNIWPVKFCQIYSHGFIWPVEFGQIDWHTFIWLVKYVQILFDLTSFESIFGKLKWFAQVYFPATTTHILAIASQHFSVSRNLGGNTHSCHVLDNHRRPKSRKSTSETKVCTWSNWNLLLELSFTKITFHSFFHYHSTGISHVWYGMVWYDFKGNSLSESHYIMILL